MVISLSSLPGDLFTESHLVVQYSVGSLTNKKCQIYLTSLFDTGATNIAFVDLAIACHMCKVLQILFISLAKPKPVRGFDGRPASDITHAIYFMLTVQNYSELLTPMLVTKLDQHPLILGKPWMQKHGLIIDISCNKITFWSSYCQHSMAEAKSRGIALAPSQSKPMRGQKEVLV